MKNLSTKFLLFVALSFSIVAGALMTTHSQLAAAGDLQVTTEDGVMYVSSEGEVIDPDAEVVITQENRNWFTVVPPRGFAQNFAVYFNSVLSAVMLIAGLLVFYMLITAGIEWITSGGEKGNTDSARNKIVAAIIGIVILAASYAILLIILNFLGFSDLNDLFGSIGTINDPPTATTSTRIRILAEPSPTPTPSPASRLR
jgi:hypothetical protein